MFGKFKSCRFIIKLMIFFPLFWIMGFCFISLVYLLPTERMQGHVSDSKDLFAREGTYPYLMYWHADSCLDNCTDALMLLTASYGDCFSFSDAMLNKEPYVEGETPDQVLVRYFSEEDATYEEMTYGRYWHGYLVLLKPLLLFFDYSQIRYILMLSYLILLSVIVGLSVYRGKVQYLPPLLAVYYFWNPLALSLSMQFSSVAILTLLQFVLFLIFEKNYKEGGRKFWIYHFLIVGSLTSYFDLLTYPMVTFGIPAAYLICVYAKGFKDRVVLFFGTFFAWCSGYAGMWMGKWLLGSLVTGTNILQDAVQTARYRSGYQYERTGGELFSWKEVWKKNILVKRDILIVLFLFTILCLLITFLQRKKLRTENLALLLFIILPFVWYTAVANHSFIHVFFTYREISILVYAVLIFDLLILTKKGERENKEKGSG